MPEKGAGKDREGFFKRLINSDNVSFARWLKFYPPFVFFGIKIRLSADYKTININVPLRWYFKNNSGVMFGAVLSIASDPFPALLFQKIIPECIAWTRSHQIQYLRPCKSTVSMQYQVSDDDIANLVTLLEEKGKAEKQFEYFFYDEKGKKVAKVTNIAYLVRK